MGSKERRERDKAEIRETILDAAREMFAEFGYEGVSMRKIAERIEYSATTIYLHFTDKNALIRELCYADFRKLSAVLKDVLALPNPIDRLMRIGDAYVRFGVTYPNHYRLMFMTRNPAGDDPVLVETVKGNPETDSYALLQWAVAEIAKAGLLLGPVEDIELVAQTLWAAVHGVVALEIAMQCDEWLPWRPLSDRSRAMLDAIGYGLFARRN